MELEVDWEWFDKYEIHNRNTNKFQYGNIFVAHVVIYLA